jgi:hypothetical protein
VFVIRYAALLALALCLGGTFVSAFSGDFPDGGTSAVQLQTIVAACGAVIVVALFLMKFIGPPPRSFTLRAAIAGLLMLLAADAAFLHGPAGPITAINGALGLVLLSWYARE